MTHRSYARLLAQRSLLEGVHLRRGLVETATDAVLSASEMLVECYQQGHKVLLCGNGGSAADAQHLSAELVGRFVQERRPLPAIALSVDPSAVTAIANDYGYDEVFARQVQAHGVAGDVLIAISTSGNSPNVVAAANRARSLGMKTIALTGGSGGKLRELADVCLSIASSNTARIQECHITVGHILCELLEAAMFLPAPSDELPPDTHGHHKVLSLEALLQIRHLLRQQKRTMVWTNGCFDILHAGHVASLRAARAEGDVLVVGLNSDASVRRRKGPQRPVFDESARAQVLAALEDVDYITVFDEDTPAEVLDRLQPDVHCKGADYAPPHGQPIAEAEVVAGYGGRIVFLPLLAGLSTSSALRKLGDEL